MRARAPSFLHGMANRLDQVQRYEKLEEFLPDQPHSGIFPDTLSEGLSPVISPLFQLHNGIPHVGIASQRQSYQNSLVTTRVYDIFAIKNSLPSSSGAGMLRQTAADA